MRNNGVEAQVGPRRRRDNNAVRVEASGALAGPLFSVISLRCAAPSDKASHSELGRRCVPVRLQQGLVNAAHISLSLNG